MRHQLRIPPREMSDAMVLEFFKVLDPHGNGEVHIDELLDFMLTGVLPDHGVQDRDWLLSPEPQTHPSTATPSSRPSSASASSRPTSAMGRIEEVRSSRPSSATSFKERVLEDDYRWRGATDYRP